MQFGEKLDFLMTVTKTTNSALSKNIKLDASYISRLRSGKRGALKDATCIHQIASYLACHCPLEEQKTAICHALQLDLDSFGTEAFSTAIAQWMQYSQGTSDVITVGSFLDRLSNAAPYPSMSVHSIPEDVQNTTLTQVAIYYGVEGKRQSALRFLSSVLEQNRPRTLLLFSDEATDWMTADRDYALKWASLMVQVLEKGNKIKVIHTVSRDLDEMLSAINQWMPLYMSGAIEPYFYPKKRDGVIKRTLFIAPGAAAVISNTIGDMTNQAANLFFTENPVISTFETEFYQYLRLCKPLMKIFTAKDEKAYYTTLMGFEKEKSDSIIKTESLSLLTMPEEVFSSIAARIGAHFNALEFQLRRTKHFFEHNLETNRFFELIRLPDIETATTPNRIKVAFSMMLSGASGYYTLEEFIQHLEHLVFLSKSYYNFHVILTEQVTDDRYMVYAREDLGVIVASTVRTPVVLEMTESNMTAAFWGFLSHIIEKKSYRDANKNETIQKLTTYIHDLKRYL